MLIKIISYEGEYHDDFDRWVVHDVTNWEEVDEEQYRQLVGWCQMKNNSSRYDEKYIIFRQDQIDFKRAIADYLAHIEAERAAAEKKRLAAETRRKMKQAAKQKLEESQEIELMNQLLAKHKDKIK